MQADLATVFVVTFLSAIGAPVPALPVLLLAGAAAAGDAWLGVEAFGTATAASVVAASVWYAAGRRLGRRVLALLCWISISPDTCIRKNELSFARRGALTLVVANFVPGLSILAPPLAGALGMRARSFLLFSTLGALLWVLAGLAAGLLFEAQIRWLLDTLRALGGVAVLVVVGLLAAYVAWRGRERRRAARELARFERIEPGELAGLIVAGVRPVIVDVRALALRDGPAQRLPGALNIDLAALEAAAFADWPADAEVITYCDCPNDASAVRAAQLLAKRGRRARVLAGGLEAWTRAGHPIESLEARVAVGPTARPA
ncbi:MAG: VTT domain-containing protein [Pelomonas sp.]|nr:VTT domain-containing protein [Roseateles sp.]